jgi:DNA (cytosine-5)-methyltransferase 1
MIYGSVCSGIEAATVAWHPLGWRPAFFSEIEKFPSALLAHHYPDVPNLGDMTKYREWPNVRALNVLVGGTPCQSFSVAGLRKGLDDPRGNLALVYLGLVDRFRPRWFVWENVPGVLSSGHGRDFGAFLGAVVQLGYGFAYRVLDAQFFGVPQRRRRVFVVGYLGDWRPAAAVLFERESLRGDSPPRRETGEGIANAITERPDRGGGNSEGQRLIPSLAKAVRTMSGGIDREDSHTLIAHSLRAEGFDASEDGTGRGTPLVPTFAIQERAVSENLENGPQGSGIRDDGLAYTLEARNKVQAVAFSSKDHGADAGDIAPTLRSMGHDGGHANGGGQVAVVHAFTQEQEPKWEGGDETAHTLGTYNGRKQAAAVGMAVRRLTPRECERLQGFPDDYTLIPYRNKPAADGPRYKALGNSMAVPVMRWIGQRIAMVQAMSTGQ